MSLVGRRVSIASTSPPADATVSVVTFGAGSPTSGIWSSAFVITWSWPGAATGFPLTIVTAITTYLPGLANGTWAAYTAANGSASVAACCERYGASVTSTSAGATYGPRAGESGVRATYSAVLP